MATGLPFLEGVEVVSTDAVDPNPVFNEYSFHKDGELVRKDGAVYQVVIDGETTEYYNLATGTSIEAGQVTFNYVSGEYFKCNRGYSLFPFADNTEYCPIADYDVPRPYKIVYRQITADLVFNTWYQYQVAIQDVAPYYKFTDEGGGQYRLYIESRQFSTQAVLTSSDRLVNVRTPNEDPLTFTAVDDVLQIGDSLYLIASATYWTQLQNEQYFNIYTPGYLYYSALLKDKPFDLQANTRATKDISLNYVCKPSNSQSYNTLILDGLVGDSVTITINSATTVYDLNNISDGETIIHYMPSLGLVTFNATILVESTATAEIGTIAFSSELVDMGTTLFDIDFDLTDYSPQEEKAGGYIDYVEGVALETKKVNIAEKAEKLPDILSNLKRFKKKLMAFDLTDSYIEEHFLSDIMKMVGRINESSVTLKSVASIQEDDIINGSYTIEQGS